jgi:predicted ribosome quality control (RQC) complex YloA/Tae2 family protein
VVAPLLARAWQPGIAEDEQGVQAYSVYPLTVLPGWHPTESVSAAISAFYGGAVGPDAYHAAKEPARAALHEAHGKVRARLASLQRSLTDDAERERLRTAGELVLAYQYAVTPKQTALEVLLDEGQPPVVIALDPTLTPVENAQRYFEKYQKAKRALEDVPNLIEKAQAELATLEQLGVDLELATNWPEIDEVVHTLQGMGVWRGKAPSRSGGGKSAPLRLVTGEGIVIWVGRNSRQNEQVTFEKGGPLDLWLHARGVPGAHVIIKDAAPPEHVIEQAAALAAYYSAQRQNTRVEVDVTERRHVRKIKGAGQGMVTYRNERTLAVAPRASLEP